VEAAEKICIQHTNETLTVDRRPFWGRWAKPWPETEPDPNGDGDADGVDSRRLAVKR